MNDVHELASGIRDTVERTYDQIWNIFETLTSVGLAQARPNKTTLEIWDTTILQIYRTWSDEWVPMYQLNWIHDY